MRRRGYGRSPKGARKHVGLDVKAVGGMAEVQKGQETASEWTSKLQESSQKSKRIKTASDWTSKQQNATQKSTRPRKIPTLHVKTSPPLEVPTTIISSPSYPISISFICGEYVKRYEEATGVDRLHILNRTIEDIRKKMYMK